MTILIVAGLMVGTGVIAAAGIAGDSAGESYIRNLQEQAGGTDGVLDAQRWGLDPDVAMTRESVDLLVGHGSLAGIVERYTGALRQDLKIGPTESAGKEMGVWGIEPDSYGQVLQWEALEGELPRNLGEWSADQFIINEQAAMELGLISGDPIHLVLDSADDYRLWSHVETWRETGHFQFATQNPHPLFDDYYHSPENQHEFSFQIDDDPHEAEGVHVTNRLLFFNASTEEGTDLHLEVEAPDGSSDRDGSAGPEATIVWRDPLPGLWNVTLHSPFAVDVDTSLNLTMVWEGAETVGGGETYEGTVRAIVPTKGSDPIHPGPSAFLPLPVLQGILERDDFVNVVLVSAVENTDPERLEEALRAANQATWGGQADVIVPRTDHWAEGLQENVQRLLMIFSTFTLTGGILLIFVLMALLVEDRKRTIAVMRAIGAQRSDVTRMHVSEGTVYAGLAAFAGVLFGIAVVLMLARPLGRQFGSGERGMSLYMDPMTVLGAIGAGFALTILIIAIAAHRAGRLDLPSALRGEEPERPPPNLMSTVKSMLLAVIGASLAAIGFALAWPALSYLGLTLLVVSGSWVVSRSLRRRPFVAANAGLVLLLTLLYLPVLSLDDEATALLLPVLTLGFGMSTSLLLVYTQRVHRLVVAAAGRIRGAVPIVETALSHLRARPGRSALIAGLLATVLLVTTVFVGLLAAVESPNLGDGGGFTVLGETEASIDDPAMHLEAYPPRDHHDPFSKAKAIVSTSWYGAGGFVPVAPTGDSSNEVIRSINPAYKDDVIGLTPSFTATSRFENVQVRSGFAGIQDAFTAVLDDPNLVIVADHMVVAATGTMGDSRSDGRTLEIGDKITIRGQTESGEDHPTLEIIAVIPDSGVSGFYVHPAVLQTLGEPGTRLWATPGEGISDIQLASDLEGAFRSVVLETTIVSDPYPEQREEARNLQLIIGTYLGIGLIVGIVGIGLISVRSVLIRRREITTLRALGATPKQIIAMFAFEALYVTSAAVGIALVGAALVAQAVFADEQFIAAASLEWSILFPLYAATLFAATAMAFLAARQAARMDPSEALGSMD